MFLRTRWAMGAAEWMSGRHDSKQNDKEILGYSDKEWNFIWDTMLEDGAWAVPDIKDSLGNTIKGNHAPEMFIKYIAHDLQCHIIVFDLLLGQVQFCSANHVKDENVSFDSPILLYSTGGHFQSVLPKDQEYFINHAKELEERNIGIPTSSNLEAEVRSEKKIPNSFNSKKTVSDPPPYPHRVADYEETGHREEYNPNKFVKPATEPEAFSPSIKRSVLKKRKPPTPKGEPLIEISNRYQHLSSEDENEPTENSKHLKKRKSDLNVEKSSKDMDGIVNGERDKEGARKKASREEKSQEEKDRIKERDKIRKRAARAAQSVEDKARSRSRNTESKKTAKEAQSEEEQARIREMKTMTQKSARKSQSVEEKAINRARNTKSKKAARAAQPVEDKARSRSKNAESKKKAKEVQSEEENARIRALNTKIKKTARESQSVEDKDRSKAKNAVSKKTAKEAQSAEEQARSRLMNAKSRKAAKEAQSEEEQARIQALNTKTKKSAR